MSKEVNDQGASRELLLPGGMSVCVLGSEGTTYLPDIPSLGIASFPGFTEKEVQLVILVFRLKAHRESRA